MSFIRVIGSLNTTDDFFLKYVFHASKQEYCLFLNPMSLPNFVQE